MIATNSFKAGSELNLTKKPYKILTFIYLTTSGSFCLIFNLSMMSLVGGSASDET